MLLAGERLGEDVGDHLVRRAELDLRTFASHDVVAEVMILATNVLRTCAELRLLREDDRADVVTVDDSGTVLFFADFCKESAQPGKVLTNVAECNVLGLGG